jgi:nicotinic acid mononucleotide adenylyltransferase
MSDRKPGAAAALRDLATQRVNAQLIKAEAHTARPWSPDAGRLATLDAAVLQSWSARESSAHLAEVVEQTIATLDPLIRQTHTEALNLVDRIDAVLIVARDGTDRLARWTKILALVAAGLLIVAAFQIWLVWSTLTSR